LITFGSNIKNFIESYDIKVLDELIFDNKVKPTKISNTKIRNKDLT
jgi:hypothetical protein